MLKVNPTVVTLGIAGILAIAVGFYVNSVNWGRLAEEKTQAGHAGDRRSSTTTTADQARNEDRRTWAASATGRVEPKSGEIRIRPTFPAASRTSPSISTTT